MRWCDLFILLGGLLFYQAAAPPAPATPPVPAAQMPADAAIMRILIDRIDVQKQGVGAVVGVIDPQGRRVVWLGRAGSDAVALNGDTVFEIGSVTKVFTAVLLADAVKRGEVALTDPVSKFLPPEAKLPERGGRQITLQDLATHSSGLPRLPANLAPKDPGNPYADYSVAQLYSFLGSYQLPRDIGAQYEYSNLGAGLLGHALARRAGMEYEALVRTRILEPLKMTSTVMTLTEPLRGRLAQGHNAQARAVPNWDIPTLAGAGALRSTANDMLNFLAAQLGDAQGPLGPAMASTLEVRRPTSSPAMQIALGWHVLSVGGGRELVWHNGGTGGYRSFMGFDPKERTGVVVLSNMSTPAGMDDIGRHLLDSKLPLLAPVTPRKEIAVTPEILDRYVGRYQLAPEFIITVSREGNRFWLQATGQPKFELFAESERKFFLKVVDAQVTFEGPADGRATQLILHQNGANQPAKRIE